MARRRERQSEYRRRADKAAAAFALAGRAVRPARPEAAGQQVKPPAEQPDEGSKQTAPDVARKDES